MDRKSADSAASAIEKGDGCSALDNYMIGQSSTREEWQELLQTVVEANKAHRAAAPGAPELTITSKADALNDGTIIGITRSDIEGRGKASNLVDRKFATKNGVEYSHSYDCNKL